MAAVRELAETNVKISVAKNTLSSILTTKDEYLKKRELEAVEMIKGVLDRSTILLSDISKNFEAIKEVKGLVTNIVEFAQTFSEEMKVMKDDLAKDTEKTIEAVHTWKASLDAREKDLKDSMAVIESEKKLLKQGQVVLEKAQRRLRSDQSALKTAYQEIQSKKL